MVAKKMKRGDGENNVIYRVSKKKGNVLMRNVMLLLSRVAQQVNLCKQSKQNEIHPPIVIKIKNKLLMGYFSVVANFCLSNPQPFSHFGM